jgi:DNA repair protein RadD
MRSTKSPSLYVQMCGRGMRPATGKTDCLELDYGRNVVTHGPVDEIEWPEVEKPKPKYEGRVCPKCRNVCRAGENPCKNCGHMFPAPKTQSPEQKLDADASTAKPMTMAEREAHDAETLGELRDVLTVDPRVHPRKNGDKCLRVGYKTRSGWVSEFLFPGPRDCRKRNSVAFRRWWASKDKTAASPPESTDEAIRKFSELPRPSKIRVLQQPSGFPLITWA